MGLARAIQRGLERLWDRIVPPSALEFPSPEWYQWRRDNVLIDLPRDTPEWTAWQTLLTEWTCSKPVKDVLAKQSIRDLAD